jgi:hypothetical protein
MTIANINRFIKLFADAFAALGSHAPIHEVERMAMIAHSAMENKRRIYHNSMHVFQLCEGMNPRQVLAALFHDVVYYQLDGCYPQRAAVALEGVTHNQNGALIPQEIDKDDSSLQLCADIFGFQPGQTLPLSRGLNEFLSAVVAAKLLLPYLQTRDLIAIIACIEATVPFRGTDAKGLDMPAVLAGRVREQSRKLLKNLSSDEIERYTAEVLIDAVKMANRDVAGFEEPNPGRFLAETWLLIEESNATLEDVGVYTLQDYRSALSRTEKFYGGLNPENIFHQFNHFPSDAEFVRLTEAAIKNIVFAQDFLGAKIASIAIIEALALETGGDCPVSMFLGDIRSHHGKPNRVEDYLPPAKVAPDIDTQLLQVLKEGRAQESINDLTVSPLTSFIYCYLGHDGTMLALRQAKRMFESELSAFNFLKGLNQEMMSSIIGACAQITASRREALLKLQIMLSKP